MKTKTAGTIYVLGGLYYLLAELVSAIFFKDSLAYTYLFHTISELGIPSVNSPLSALMNSAFIIIGLTLIIGNLYGLKEHITRNRLVFSVLTVISALGVIIVGIIHGGNPLTSGYHTLGAVMTILGGNILLILVSRSLLEQGNYPRITLVLGVIGLIAFWIMFFNMTSIYMPVFERLSVYPMILWSLKTGYFLYKS